MHDIERAERRERAGDKGFDACFMAGIGDHRFCSSAGLRDKRRGLLHGIGILIGDQQAGAFACEHDGCGTADAASRTRHDR